MVAAVLGMIPEGLVLLTSVALTLGSMVLATKKTLVQELYCIETLARVDTLCLDKTGTITEGTMKVEDVQLYESGQDSGEKTIDTDAETEAGSDSMEDATSEADKKKLQEMEHIMENLMSVLHDQNATADALRKRFPAK